MTEELLVNFKNLMQRWFPLTTTVNNQLDDVMDKSAIDYNIRSENVLMLNHNTIIDTDVPQDGWVYDAVQSFLEAQSEGEYGVIKYMDEFAPTVLFFRYDMVNETLDMLNNYHVNLEASNYNPNIDSTVTITATVTDEFGNPIQYFPVNLKKNGSSLSQGITNNGGISTFSYSCSSVGLQCFSINDSNIFVDVAGEAYPVGSIYMSVNSTNPSTIFGGTWERLKDRFLLASGDTYSNGSTGGAATHTLTVDEMPSHTHTQNSHYHGIGDGRAYITHDSSHNSNVGESRVQSGSSFYVPSIQSSDNWYGTNSTSAATATNQNKGGGRAHNNMPPYLSVFMWKRIA